MEYKYYRELKHNYLVFENNDEKELENDRYQYRIAESGRIKGVLACSERNINGKSYFYYEIGSMQTLKDRYMSVKMGYEDLYRLLGSIKSMLESLSEFLLGDEAIVFNTGNIFTDLATGEFGFIFCPFFDEEKSFSEFATQLLDILDDSDERATEIVYNLCERAAERGSFAYEIISQTLDEYTDEEPKQVENKIGIESKPMKEAYNDTYQEDMYSFDEESYEPEDTVSKKKKNSGIKRANEKLSGKIQVMIAILFFCVIAAMMYIRMNFVLSGEENIMSVIVMLVSAISGVIAFFGGSKQMKKAKLQNSEEAEDYKEDEDFDDLEDADTDDFTSFDESFEEMKTPETKPVFEKRVSARATTSYDRALLSSNETVVLDEAYEGPMTLFSRNLDKTVRIALDKLPVTVGKLQGCVDAVIPDMSISRMHCRIVSDGDGYAIYDLGSTNGTYRNGERLRPQEKTRIEEGDEIRIGRVCFDCR